MNIIDNNIKDFGALKCGDVFKMKDGNCYYLKCACDMIVELGNCFVIDVNEDTTITTIEYDTPVELIKCNLVIE